MFELPYTHGTLGKVLLTVAVIAMVGTAWRTIVHFNGQFRLLAESLEGLFGTKGGHGLPARPSVMERLADIEAARLLDVERIHNLEVAMTETSRAAAQAAESAAAAAASATAAQQMCAGMLQGYQALQEELAKLRRSGLATAT